MSQPKDNNQRLDSDAPKAARQARVETNPKITTPHVGGSVARKGLETDSCCAWDGETLVLNILGKPSAKQDAIGKVKANQLKVSVTATPVAGRATDHMVRFLAKEFGVASNDIEVVLADSM